MQLIAKEKRERTGKLDLTQCGLVIIPAEIVELFWLEILILRNKQFLSKNNNGSWSVYIDQNGLNEIIDLSLIANLHNLQELDCSGTSISDLSPLARLQNLQWLNCYDTQVSDLAPLVHLQNLQKLDCSKTKTIVFSHA